MIGYALDGYAIFAPLEEGDPDLAELDQCGGHTTDGIGYHYHANPAEANSVLSCLTGAIVGDVGGGGPGGGGPPDGGGGPGGGGDPPTGDPSATLPASAYTGDYTLADEEFGTMVAVTVEGDTRTIVSNALPDHEVGDFPNNGNPNTISAQSLTSELPVEGTFVGTPSFALSPGIAVNGVPFIPGTAETVTCNSGEVYRVEAIQEVYNLGLDFNNAHVQPNGQYHYHGVSELLVDAYAADEDLVHVGFAADGFLVYYSKSDAHKSGYVLSTEASTGTDCIASGPAGGDAVAIAGTMPDGTYGSDWVHTHDRDLDECNGTTVGDEYVYFVTDNYPYISRCLMGEVAGGGGPGGGGPPPGGGPQGGGPPGGGPPAGAAAAALAELDTDFLDLVADDLMDALATG